MYSSPTGRRGQATWRGCDHRFAHRPSLPHRSLWHATQRHHHAVDPRKNHLMSLQSWHKAGFRDPLVQGGEEGMCQEFCIRKSIVLKCKTKHAFRPFGGQKKKSRSNRSRAASQFRSNAPFRNELNALPCGQFGHKGPPLPTMVLPLNRLKREKLQYTSSQEKSLPPKGKPKKNTSNAHNDCTMMWLFVCCHLALQFKYLDSLVT